MTTPAAAVPMSSLTTLKVGGEAMVYEVGSEDDLQIVCRELTQQGTPFRILGGGSNILASDTLLAEAVIKINLTGREFTQTNDVVLLTVGAGENFDSVVAYCVEQGWWGIENLSHIPGTIGATPVQNVGAYGVEIKDVLESVRVYDTDTDTFETLTVDECEFGYRDSIFKHEVGQRYIITAVTLRLSTTPRPQLTYKDLATRFNEHTPTLSDIRAAVIEIRSHKFPDWHTVGTAGSFFKNPIIPRADYDALLTRYPELPMYPVSDTLVKLPLGYVLDRICGLRGVAEGNVGTYEGQALVLINHGAATAAEITAFANKIAATVKEKTDIEIEWEVTRW